MKPRDIPNLITFFRFLLVVPVVYYLLREQYLVALILFAIAGISDGIDGFLARSLGWQSRLGSILDPLADKLLLVSCFLTLAWLGKLTSGLVFAVIIRDVIIILGAAAYHFLVGRYEMAPSAISKLNTVCQLTLVVVVLVSEGLYTLPHEYITLFSILVWLTTVASGALYVWEWGASALKHKKENS